MTSFDEREKAYENKFAHDEELKFRITSRRRKLLGLWAAEAMGLDDAASLEYAVEIVNYGMDDQKPGAVVKKIFEDAQRRSVELPEAKIRSKNSEFEITAQKQVMKA